jgi:hypothetical protein
MSILSYASPNDGGTFDYAISGPDAEIYFSSVSIRSHENE